MSIRAVIFDLNGVFIQSPKLSDSFQAEFGVSTEKFLPALKTVLKTARMPGCKDSFVLWKPYLEQWGINLKKEEFFSFWFGKERQIQELIDYAKVLRNSGIKVIALSNNFMERTNYYSEYFPFMHEGFDAKYFSWQTGFVKPDQEAYEKVLCDFNLNPEECVYFDDSEENIEVAKSLGINGHIYKNLEDVKAKLRNGEKNDQKEYQNGL